MAFKLPDRMQFTTESTGTGSITVIPPDTGSGFTAPADELANNDTTALVLDDGNGGWEISICTYTAGSPGSFSRDTVLKSTNSGSKIDFDPGVKTAFCAFPQELMLFFATKPTFADGQIPQRVSGAWAVQTIAQALKVLLTTANDIPQNVGGTVVRRTPTQIAASLAPVFAAAAIDQSAINFLTLLTADNNFLQRKSGAIAQRTPAQVAADLQSLLTTAFLGVTDGSDAASGNMGEYVSAQISAGSAVSLTNNTVANVTSISLPAGDWDVSGTAAFTANGATVTTRLFMTINTVSATLLSNPANGAQQEWDGSNTGTIGSWPIGPTRLSLTSTTTVYLITRANFTTNTLAAYGFIRARRVR